MLNGTFSSSLRKLFAGDKATVVFVRIAAILASLGSSITLARVLGPDGYGIYAFINSIVFLLLLPVQLGLPVLVIRETAKANATGDIAGLHSVRRWSINLVILGSSIVILGVLALLNLFPLWLEEEKRATLMWALALIPMLAVGAINASTLRGLKHLFWGLFPTGALQPSLLSGMLLALGLYVSASTVYASQAMILNCMAAAIVLLVTTMALRRVRPPMPSTSSELVYEHKYWSRSLVPLSMIAGLQLISQSTDLLMLGYFSSNEDVALYRVALNGASMVVFGLTAVNMVVQPKFAAMHARSDISGLQVLATSAARYCLVLTIPIIVIVAIFGCELISVLFGDEYSGSYQPMIILAGAQFFNAFFGSAGNLLSMAGYEKYAMRALFVSAALNVGLNFVLIPIYGINGAAYATGASIIILNVMYWYVAMAKLGVRTDPIGCLKENKT